MATKAKGTAWSRERIDADAAELESSADRTISSNRRKGHSPLGQYGAGEGL